MKARQRQINTRTRPPWWPTLLSLIVAFSLVMQPLCQCAMAQSAIGHSHQDAPGQHSHDQMPSDHSCCSGAQEAGEHHDDAQHDDAQRRHAEPTTEHRHSHHSDTRHASVSPFSQQHLCCCDTQVAPSGAVLARSSAPDQNHQTWVFAPATLPVAFTVFALTNCHGRDGPPAAPLLCQFAAASLLGRAPPVAV